MGVVAELARLPPFPSTYPRLRPPLHPEVPTVGFQQCLPLYPPLYPSRQAVADLSYPEKETAEVLRGRL